MIKYVAAKLTNFELTVAKKEHGDYALMVIPDHKDGYGFEITKEELVEIRRVLYTID